MDHTRDMRSYMVALEEERRKIQVFQRELPLCMELVTQAIDACTKQLATKECNEIIKEFIPIRRVSTSSDHIDDEVVDADDDELHSHSPSSIDDDDDRKKSEWLRSVSLWNPNPDTIPLDHQVGTTAAKSEASSWSERVASPPGSATTSSAAGGGGVNRSDGPTTRKQRRCWSPELHRRFVHALQQLGGSHAATPKQIRDLMKVDGLTNDEVKSHLQKYRLHTRRPSPSAPSPQQRQFVVVGGIWAPPPPPRAAEAAGIHHHVAASATSSGVSNIAAANRKYVTLPLTAAPPQQRRRKGETSEETRTTHPEEASNSAADSSSTTHTISVC